MCRMMAHFHCVYPSTVADETSAGAGAGAGACGAGLAGACGAGLAGAGACGAGLAGGLIDATLLCLSLIGLS